LNILALDTSSSLGSIALAKNDRICFASLLDIKATHSERLLPQIDEGLKLTGLKIADLDLICVGNGPGSFTGIRIGLATAKGLCLGNRIPLQPFNTLEILANNLIYPQYPILTMLDAKMNEIYGALYDTDLTEIIPPRNADPEEFLSLIEQKVIIIGDGTLKYKHLIDKLSIKYETVLAHHHIPAATTMIGIVLNNNMQQEYDLEIISDLEPYYLRKSQAELVRDKKLEQENK